LNELTGIGRRMPLTGLVFAVAALAIMGVPTLNGFMSELYIIAAGVDARMYIPTGLMLVNIAISVAYYLRVMQITLLRQPSEKLNGVKETPASMLAPMVAIMVLLFVIGLYPQPFLSFAQQAAQATMDTEGYIRPILGKVSP
ncbi:MAG: proton-conducting transporter membrane subunit, partial [Candidatus Bathyarchaeia archaeon]